MSDQGDLGGRLLRELVEFAELLRNEDLQVTPAESIDSARALLAFGSISELDPFRDLLRTTLIKKSEDFPLFEDLFRRFWLDRTFEKNPLGRINYPSVGEEIKRSVRSPVSNRLGKGRITSGSSRLAQSLPRNQSGTDLNQVFAIYSPVEIESRKNFALLDSQSDRLSLKRGIRAFARTLATLPGRRYNTTEDFQGILDFRRTIRSSLKTGGNVTEPLRRTRKITKSRFTVLCDISGSMDVFSEKILNFIHQISNTIRTAQVYGFSTQVVPLNRYLQGKSLRQSAELISKHVDIWSSGTRIGFALEEILSRFPGVLRSTTIFIIISDGWELGDLEIFKSHLRDTKRRVRQIVWLNPQADNPDYQPLAEGMRAAMPFVDTFSGLDIFTDKRKFAQRIGTPGHRRILP